jgi:putative alpha-1,2-mannosidase
MGFYPVCPTAGQYVLGAPLFNKITLSLENGKKVIINAPNNSANNKYVSGLTYNGKPYDFNWLSHTSLMQGATLNFNMSAKPNKLKGIKEVDFPYSLSNEK